MEHPDWILPDAVRLQPRQEPQGANGPALLRVLEDAVACQDLVLLGVL